MKIRDAVVSLSAKIHNTTHRYTGSTFGVIVVNEFPKSGGTWLAKVLASALELQFRDGIVGVPVSPCIVRTHWKPDRLSKNTIYIVRDGRDVMVSLFHHRCRNLLYTPYLRDLYREKLGEDLDVREIKSQLGSFIELEHHHRRYGVQVSWNDFTDKAFGRAEHDDGSVVVKYEDLVRVPESTVHEIIGALKRKEIPHERLKHIIGFHDKKWSQTIDGSTGEKGTFVRKGVVGDWRNVFTSESGEVFSQYGNKSLLKFGYESDEKWFEKI